MDMNKDIVTLPKRGLKTRPYNIGMEKKGLKKYDHNIDMEKKDLKKLTKGQLIKLLLKKVSNHEDVLDNDPFKDEVAQKPTPPPRTGKWESVSRKSVNEDLILPPPEQFQDGYKPIPKPRTDRPQDKMHEDHQNQLENHHQSLKLKSIYGLNLNQYQRKENLKRRLLIITKDQRYHQG